MFVVFYLARSMKNLFFRINLLFLMSLMSQSLLHAQTTDAMIKITADPISRDYKVLYSSAQDNRVTVQLKSVDGATTIFEENFGVVKSFVKKYSLLDAPLGKYQWEIRYGNKTYAEEFEIMSEKKLIKESISAEMDNLLNLKITVAAYNKLPLSIFLYDGSNSQLEFIFWEPTLTERTKVINLSQFDAYDIRLEILQQGDLAFEAKYQTY